MRAALLYTLAVTVQLLPVLAQRHLGGSHGAGSFNHGGKNAPSTFITITSAAPAATAGTNAPSSSDSVGDTSSAGSSSSSSSSSVDASLIPPFGITAGVKATDGTANCVGDGGKDIPCDCPPDLNTFIGAVQQQVAGGAQFPTSNTVADQLTRLETCIVSLQNFKGGPGSGVGCPAVSTTWKELQAQLQSQVK